MGTNWLADGTALGAIAMEPEMSPASGRPELAIDETLASDWKVAHIPRAKRSTANWRLLSDLNRSSPVEQAMKSFKEVDMIETGWIERLCAYLKHIEWNSAQAVCTSSHFAGCVQCDTSQLHSTSIMMQHLLHSTALSCRRGTPRKKWLFYRSFTWFLYQGDIIAECPCPARATFFSVRDPVRRHK
jgi:hypothetical protein